QIRRSECRRVASDAIVGVGRGMSKRWVRSAGVLGDPSIDELPHQRSGQRFVRLKTYGALAGLIALEFFLVSRDRRAAHRVERAMISARAEAGDRFAVEAERAQ